MLKLIRRDEYSTNKLISKLENIELRLSELEQDVSDLRYAFKEIHNPSTASMEVVSIPKNHISSSKPTLDSKIHPSHRLDLIENNLKSAKDFIINMIENDKRAIHSQMQQRDNLIMEILPNLPKSTSSFESSHKFFDNFESEHLIDIFKSSIKRDSNLDRFSFEIGPNLKVRRSSRNVSKPSILVSEKKLKSKLKSKTNNKTKSSVKLRSKSVTKDKNNIRTKKIISRNQSKVTSKIKKKNQKRDLGKTKIIIANKKDINHSIKKSKKTQNKKEKILNSVSKLDNSKDSSGKFMKEKLHKLKFKNTAPLGKEFYFYNGHKICSLFELADYLSNADDSFYHMHVSGNRNDFATWVSDVFSLKRLSGLIYLTKSREELVKLLRSL
ncbi:MAG: hypothetical protein ACMXYG_00450 [Candidatus Woesearchaeota archaeon]